MIQGLMPAVPSAPVVSSATASPVAPDKGFSSVLKSSVKTSIGTDSGEKSASATDPGTKDTSDSTNPIQPNASAETQDRTAVKDSPAVNEPKDKQRVQDPNEILMQSIFQMTAGSQQIICQPLPKKDASVTAESVTQGAQTLQAVLVPGTADVARDLSSSSSAAQIGAETPAASQTKNFFAALATNQAASPNKIDVKSQDKTSSNTIDELFSSEKDSQQSSSPYAAQGTVDSVKAETELKALNEGGKDAVLMSKTAGSSNAPLSQFKIDTSLNQATGQPSAVKEFASASSGLYAQTMQAQPVLGRDQSPIQETVPANKLTTLDEVISKAMDTGQRNLVIRIDPPDLGSMHIRLSLDNGVLKANVSVDSNSVKDSFNLVMPQIRTSLENSGIKVSEFHVDVREDQYRNGQERNNQGQQQQRQEGRESQNGFSDFFA
jgi:flagellar hook-length control protein FliK